MLARPFPQCRDMMVDVPLISNLIAIRNKRQQHVDESARRENAKRIKHVFKIGDKANMITCDPTKLEPRTHGPHEITQVFTNGTAKMSKDEVTEEIVNIRKLFPHKE